eukprot:TRINITY_DN2793_c0_g9_i1.p2 TRINITY_DN2793_c0_g9~~TRINITY_DN2793_c0_g9_i1.p2  ORF type:complete len:157 (-),score=45.44 TRINITY_DN2793_c0_g9_i1:58-528(-)
MIKTFQDYPMVSAEIGGSNAAISTQPKAQSKSASKSKVVNEQFKVEAMQKPENKKEPSEKEPNSEAEQEFGEEMEQCAPITTMSINNMFKASNYLKESSDKSKTPLREAYELENDIDEQAEEVNEEKDLMMKEESRAENIIPVSYTHLTLPTICSV